MNRRFALFLLMAVAFLDYMGVGIVFPILPSILFNSDLPLLGMDPTPFAKGMWMGILIALTPLFQFFASPILGSLSDQRGRKKMILFGLSIGLIGYVFGILGIQFRSLGFLILYRSLFGLSTATMTVVQAALVDMSTPKNKARLFARYNMALGIGFSIGPFLGGVLSDSNLVSWFNFTTPFWVGAFATALNLFLLHFRFSETRKLAKEEPIEWLRGARHAKIAVSHPTLRFAFLSLTLFLFGWDYFDEFIGVTLIQVFHFRTAGVGNFYAFAGVCYAIFNLLAVGFFTKRFSTDRILLFSMPIAGLYLALAIFIENPLMIWVFLPLLILLMALFFPVASTFISDSGDADSQGELLGIYHSVQAIALILSPLFSGSLVGNIPKMPIYLGSVFMFSGGLIFIFNHYRKRATISE